MTALTADRNTPRRDGREMSDPLAAGAVIFAGALYALDNTGNAVKATAGGNAARGVAQAQAVQANGDSRVQGRRGTYRFANSAGAAEVTRAHIGQPAFVADDQTVGKTGTAVAGLVLDVEDGDVWVDVGAASVTVSAAP